MGMLLPLFVAGIALLAVPFFVHRIRRPEREVQRFSSLLFVPDIKRDVIERRRLQHVPLMLLRMLLLLLLALAFSRPYIEENLRAVFAPEPSAAFHIVALDASASMAAEGVMEEAIERARALVDSLPSAERVGVLFFDEQSELVAPIYDIADPEVGSAQRAFEVLAGGRAGWRATDYAAVLQDAEGLLAAVGDENARRIVHLISDFQESAMPQIDDWRLASAIELNPVYVGSEVMDNLAVQDALVRVLATGEMQVRARIKNWSPAIDRRAEVALVIDGERLEVQERVLAPASASQFTFTIPEQKGANTAGYIELGADALMRDNRFYFAWNPPAIERVHLLAGSDRYSYDRLLRAVFADDRSFVLQNVERENGTLSLANARVLVADGLYGLSVAEQVALRRLVEKGLQLFLPLGAKAESAALNRLLAGSGLQVGDLRFAREDKAVFTHIEWVDLERDIFQAFRGPRFNDFSSLRFFNYRQLQVDNIEAAFARFENGDWAMAEVALGSGRVMVWAGGVGMDWSTLARDPHFVPLMHETLRHLLATPTIADQYVVGARALAADGAETGIWLQGARRGESIRSGTPLLATGLLRWDSTAEKEANRVQAVNLRAAESDPTRVPAAEWAIRLGDAPLAYSGDIAGDDAALRREFGRLLLAAFLLFLLCESAYAYYLAQRRVEELA
jgi:Mg-chelatase subunit ChlD